jgi:protein-S-isoprenylcysteine O-methyltransferase Ste14
MNAPTTKGFVVLISRVIFVAAFLFLGARTSQFPNAWVFLAVFFVPQFLILTWLARRDPALLQRRLAGGARYEGRPIQKVSIAGIMWSVGAMMLVAGLDHRYEWSQVPAWLVRTADLAILVGFYFQFLVFRENTFASIVVKVVPEQRVISSGPYALVRHPMYAAGALINVAMPLALGSWRALPLWFLWLAAIYTRIVDEEKMLRQELPGYAEYCGKVRYRLVPGVM